MARKSVDEAYAESNARSKQLNAENFAKGVGGIRYGLMNKTGPGSWASATDPLFSSAAYVNKMSAKPTEAGSTMWSSSDPGMGWYSPTGKDWQALDEKSMSNPAAAQAAMKGAGNMTSPAYGYFSQLKSKIPASVMQGIEGSSYSLAPDVLSKMWR
jgi:hypothetical protein